MNNEVPKVVSKVGAETIATPVTSGINVVVPGNFPSGSSEPTLISSINELYKKFGVTSAPSAEDDTALLQAASLLSTTPIWAVRAHQNKVLEALTDSGEQIFFDENNQIIRHRVNINIGVDTSSYEDMWLVIGDTCFYSGEQPEGVSSENFHKLELDEVGYNNFFKALSTDSEVYQTNDLCVVVENDGSYSIYSNNPVTASSSNLVSTGDTKVSLSQLNFGSTSSSVDYKQNNFILINDNAYFNAGETATTFEYPGTPVPLPFIIKNNEQSVGAFAVYFFDFVMGRTDKKFIYVNDIYLNRTVNTKFSIESNIDILKYESGNLILPPNRIEAKGHYIMLSNEDVKIVLHNDYDTSTLDLTDDDIVISIPCNTVYRLVEGISDYLVEIRKYDDSIFVEDHSSYNLYIDDGKMISFTYSLPDTASVTSNVDVNVCHYGAQSYNTNNMKVTDCGVLIGDTEYFVGDEKKATLSNEKVQLASSAISVASLIDILTRNLPNNYNASFSGNIVSLFLSTDEQTEVKCEGGLAVQKRDISYIDVENGNTFAVKLNCNSKAKIAQFNWTWDNDEELYTVTAVVNGESYTRSIEFNNSTRVDGYGNSLYYDAFNRNFDYVTLVPIGNGRSASSYESPSFGNAVPIMEPSVGDLQTALKKLKSYHFTKFEIMVDGGFVNPAYITVMDTICKEIKAVLYSGTIPSKYVADIKEFRLGCPSNTWNTYLATPRLSDNTLGQFSVYMSPAIQYVKRIINNAKIGDEFEAVFGADKGTVSGVPEFSFDPETEQEELIQSSVNTVYYSKEASITYFNDNYTLVSEKGPMQEECIVRLINAAAHVSEMWLELNAIARKNTKKLRDDVAYGVRRTIIDRLNSNVTPYKDLKVVCDETNGNVDGSTTLYVSASCAPYGSVHRVELFTLAKALSSTEE